MSREDAELVRRAFESFAVRGLAQTAEEYWDVDIEYTEDPQWPGASRYRGRDSVLRCFQAYMDALGREEDWAVRVDRIVDAGERQVALVCFESTGTTSRVPHEHMWGYVVSLHDGRITSFRAYYRPEEALEAVGLRE